VSWRFAGASRAGTSHVREDLPCQDAWKGAVVRTRQGPALIAVVSDGAGSAAHGGDGSTLICQSLVDELSRDVPGDAAAGEAWLREAVISTRLALLEHAASRDLAGRDFAATMLCAVLTPTWSAFAQVGDGAIVTPDGTGEWAWLFWPQRGEYAHSTSFLTDPTALDSLQVDAMSGCQAEVALFTDGLQHLLLDYEQQQVHSPFFERMLVPVRASAATGQDPALSAGLMEYLGSAPVTERADDDLTLLLATQLRPADVALAGPSPAGQVAAEPA
jgi:hypothetical protein